MPKARNLPIRLRPMAKFRSFDSYSFDFAAFDVDPFGPIDPDTETWTDKTVQFETWTPKTKQSEDWTDL